MGILNVSEVYLWDQIRAIPHLGFVQFDPETNVCNEIIQILRIVVYYHANLPKAEYKIQHSMITFTITK